MKKTVLDWLLTLPDEYRTLALQNLSNNASYNSQRKLCDNLIDAIMEAFDWGRTDQRNQGYYFWHYVCEYYRGNQRELPVIKSLVKVKIEAIPPSLPRLTEEAVQMWRYYNLEGITPFSASLNLTYD